MCEKSLLSSVDANLHIGNFPALPGGIQCELVKFRKVYRSVRACQGQKGVPISASLSRSERCTDHRPVQLEAQCLYRILHHRAPRRVGIAGLAAQHYARINKQVACVVRGETRYTAHRDQVIRLQLRPARAQTYDSE